VRTSSIFFKRMPIPKCNTSQFVERETEGNLHKVSIELQRAFLGGLGMNAWPVDVHCAKFLEVVSGKGNSTEVFRFDSHTKMTNSDAIHNLGVWNCILLLE
jgi:hypothetical protein